MIGRNLEHDAYCKATFTESFPAMVEMDMEVLQAMGYSEGEE